MPQGLVPKTQPQSSPTQATRQEPLVKIPDSPNPATDNTADVIADALKAIEPVVDTKVKEASKTNGKDPPDPEDAKENGPAAKGWAAVKKAEAKSRQEREQLELDRKQLHYEMQQFKQQAELSAAQTKSSRDAFAKDPFGTLKREFGVTFDDLANLAVSDKNVVPAATENAELAKFSEKVTKIEKLLEQRAQQDAIKEYRSDIKRTLAADEYALLQTLPNAEQEVLNVCALHYQKYGEALQPEKAASTLLKYWEKHLASIASHAAARRVLGLPDEDAPKKPAPRSNGPKKTLTNSLSSSSAAPQKLPDDMTPEEELRAAAKLIPDNAWDNIS